jgi:hypothetical protein
MGEPRATFDGDQQMSTVHMNLLSDKINVTTLNAMH